MHIFDLICLMNPAVTPDQTKIHLATWNGRNNPIDVYLAGEFNEWQRWQTRKNFERTFVLSLISLPGCNRWLFAGVHITKTPEWLEEHKCWRYEMEEDHKCSEMNGRMVATFSRPGRQSYLNAESWSNQMILNEVFSERVSISEFQVSKQLISQNQSLT